MNCKPVPCSEYESVEKAASYYVEGLRAGSVELAKKAFHKDAVMYGLSGGELLGGPIENLYEFMRVNGKAENIKTHIDILAITPTTAVVRIDMENDAIGADYNDYLSLSKLDGKWQVIAKLFHMYEK